MVSTRDTEISLHVWAPWNSGWEVGTPNQLKLSKCQDLPKFSLGGVLQTNWNSKCQDLPKFSWGGTPDQLKVPRTAQILIGGGERWYSRPTQTQVPRSAEIFLAGGTPDQLKLKWNSKVPRSAQISIFKGGGEGYSRPTESQSAKICPNFHWGGGYSRPTESQSAKICPNFDWVGTPDHLKLQYLPKFSLGRGGTSDQLKVPRSAKIFIGRGRGGGRVQHEILEKGNSRNFEHKIIPLQLATASQIVFHILRMCECG